jgi:hypothetical protein
VRRPLREKSSCRCVSECGAEGGAKRAYAEIVFGDVVVEVLDLEFGAAAAVEIMSEISGLYGEGERTCQALYRRGRIGHLRVGVDACGRTSRLRSGHGPSRCMNISLRPYSDSEA